ncbi:MAG TPA: hypothetical protein VLO31_01440 [Cryobacterium sp.]|nr:hypothetical protein [Cryobacterium sp.]
MNAYITTTAKDHDLPGTYVSEEHAHALTPNGYVSDAKPDRAEGHYVSTADTARTLPASTNGLLATAAA